MAPLPPCTVFFADLIRSRRLGRQRADIQERIRRVLDDLNRRDHRAILSPFEVREGDAIRAVFAHPSVLLGAWWNLDAALGAGRIRYGIGYGELTVFRRFPDDADGPAYYAARDALAEAGRMTQRGVPGVVFRGFDRALESVRHEAPDRPVLHAMSIDRTLSAIGLLLAELRARFTRSQWEAMTYLHQRPSLTQRVVAERLSVSEPAISKRLRAAGWASYREAEDTMGTLLAAFDRTQEWHSGRRARA